jgi:hypothetical protein
VSEAFKEFEFADWRQPGRADAYDALVGRATAFLLHHVPSPERVVGKLASHAE